MLNIETATKRVEIPGDCTQGVTVFKVEGMVHHFDVFGKKRGSAGRRYEVHCPADVPDAFVEIQKTLSVIVAEEYDQNPLYPEPMDITFHMDTMQVVPPKKPTPVEKA